MSERITPQHPEGLTDGQERVILALYDLDAIRFGDFRWRVHDNHPEAPLLPIYTDFRMLQREPRAKSTAVDIYQSLIDPLEFDLIAGIPIAAVPFASSLSDRLRMGQVTPRIDVKTHGSGARVDGLRKDDKGKVTVLLDDLISFADSKIEATSVLREAELIVNDAVVLMDYGLGGNEEASKHNLKVHSAFIADQMLDFSLRAGNIPQTKHQEVKEKLDIARKYFNKA